MHILEAIKTRRSIREYIDKDISESSILQIIEAGMQAPSARNEQPWEFIIIEDPELRKKVGKFHPNAKMLSSAKAGILVCGNLKMEKSKGYWPIDCAACSQNMLLAAHGIGIGACWLGIYPREERMEACSELFNLPSYIKAFSILSLGYAANTPNTAKRKNPNNLYINQWKP